MKYSGACTHSMNCGRMKGASMIFERVILFIIGVIIFLALFAVFAGYQEYFLKVSVDDQISDIGSHISSNILRLAEKTNSTEASISVKIPSKVGDEAYTVELSQYGLNVTTAISRKSRYFHLYGLNNTYTLGGETIFSTDSNEFMIYKKGDRIIII